MSVLTELFLWAETCPYPNDSYRELKNNPAKLQAFRAWLKRNPLESQGCANLAITHTKH